VWTAPSAAVTKAVTISVPVKRRAISNSPAEKPGRPTLSMTCGIVARILLAAMAC